MPFEIRSDLPFRPIEHAEDRLLTLILSGTHPPGSLLPNERVLAQQIGVTRATLREVLQCLAREGWVTIRQGKPTQVNDFWQEGGLGLLGTLARRGEFLPPQFISHLLQVRAFLLPPMAALATVHAPQELLDQLAARGTLGEDAAGFAAFDWQVQVFLARASGNPVGVMIMNDFKTIFQQMAIHYFAFSRAREASRRYYDRLAAALIEQTEPAEAVVREAMQESMEIWLETQTKLQEGGGDVSLERLGG